MVGVIDKYVNKYRESDEMYGDTYGLSNAKYGGKNGESDDKYGENMRRMMISMGINMCPDVSLTCKLPSKHCNFLFSPQFHQGGRSCRPC